LSDMVAAVYRVCWVVVVRQWLGAEGRDEVKLAMV
jgi:hypothetical protein